MANRIPAELQPVIRKMTNWQRNQLARAGYPIDRPTVQRFSRIQKDGTELFRGDVMAPAKAA